MAKPLLGQSQINVTPVQVNIPTAKGCSSCIFGWARDMHICSTVESCGGSERRSSDAPLVSSLHRVPARRTIFRSSEWSDHVPVICDGWAMSSYAVADGRRQVLAFLLPGDMFSTVSVFERISGRLVEAITDVTYRCYKRSDIKTLLFEHPESIEVLTKTWIEEKWHTDQLAFDLGQRTADERIARLIIGLMERLEKRGLAKNLAMDFPLRQHHIAAATGLTSVHVSKVLSEFRHRGLIEIQNRSLKIVQRDEFYRIAGYADGSKY